MFYQIYDTQLEEIHNKKVSKDFIISYAYEIMKDTSEAIKGELAEEFREIIKNGVQGVSLEKAIEVLSDWEYEVLEIR